MRSALICLVLLLALPNLTRAKDANAEKKAQAAVNAFLNNCLKDNPRDTLCIGEETLACFKDDLAPVDADWFVPKPHSQIFEWCAQAERNAWQTRLDAEIQEIRDLLTNGPALREFQEQQRAWESYYAKSFPYNRFDPNEIWDMFDESAFVPLVAIRSLQVGFILDQVRLCSPDGILRDSSVCKYMNTTQ